MEDAVRPESATVERETPRTDAFGPVGTQTLVQTPASADPLTVLPARAFEDLLVVTVRDHPRMLERRLERAGHDPSAVSVVPAVPSASEYEGDLWTTAPVAPDDLTGLGMRFSDAIDRIDARTGWVLIDALGVLLVYTDELRVCRFFQTLTNRVRSKQVRGVHCVTPGAIADETHERLRGLCDAEREME